MSVFNPTDQQRDIIQHETSAFISACPGAGKTRCIVERARSSLAESKDYRGMAFLSFTNAAVTELQTRLFEKQLLPSPPFPHFIGTFDSFIWQFMVAPFGMDDCDFSLKLMPGLGDLKVQPHGSKRELSLKCFDKDTGNLIPREARRTGFSGNAARHEQQARSLRISLLEKGQLDFEDSRQLAKDNLSCPTFCELLSRVLSSRFREIIVDEAQDCNPDDLHIVNWLRANAKIPTKIVCDPNQSIYSFRGGVTDELLTYSATFDASETLPLTGNFRSRTNICKVVHTLRPPGGRGAPDDALGSFIGECPEVHILRYAGAVSSDIGINYARLVKEHGIELIDCRLCAKTHNSGKNAVGAYSGQIGSTLTLGLAVAARQFHDAEDSRNQLKAIKDTHAIVLNISGKLENRTYHQAIVEDGIEDLNWRGSIVKILQALKYDRTIGETCADWLLCAKDLLSPYLSEHDGSTIAQKLRSHQKLEAVLSASAVPGVPVRTIHDVKGKEYKSVCVVLTSSTMGGILNHLEKEPDDSKSEDAREIYVAASRAKELLVFACPKGQSDRFRDHISASGASVAVTDI